MFVSISINTYRNEHYYFFDVFFMLFELRRYSDGASNLLIEVWDSSASGRGDLRTKCRLIEIHQRHCVVSFDKTPYPLLRTFSTNEDRKLSRHD